MRVLDLHILPLLQRLYRGSLWKGSLSIQRVIFAGDVVSTNSVHCFDMDKAFNKYVSSVVRFEGKFVRSGNFQYIK